MTNTATQRGWGKPGTQKIKTATGGGISVPVAKEVVEIFSDLFEQLGKHYPLSGYGDDWGVCVRPVRGYEAEYKRTHDEKYLSNHSWGLAVDLDSSVNPMTSNPKAKREFLANVVDPILTRYKGKLIWGGEYSGSRKDYMHFEFVGTPKDAAAVAASLATKPGTPTEEKVNRLATLDKDDLAAIDAIVKKYAKAILGNTDSDDDLTHVSLADLNRKIDTKS